MILWILLAIVIATLVFKFVTGRTIPTPIPMHLARRGRNLSSDGLWMAIYRLLLVVVVVTSSVLTLLINPSGVVAFFAAGIFLWVFMDDLQKTLMDIWNGEFWRVNT